MSAGIGESQQGYWQCSSLCGTILFVDGIEWQSRMKKENYYMFTRKAFAMLALAGTLLTGCAGATSNTDANSTQAPTETNVSQAASPTASETAKQKQYIARSGWCYLQPYHCS